VGTDDADLEGQLWEKQQQLEEASHFADNLQEKVCSLGPGLISSD